MNCGYRDILDRIDEKPRWWDEHAVPRYCPFSPDEAANIYASQVALVQIECQGCGELFLVAFSWCSTDGARGARPLSERIADLHYGDPPNAGCCAAGPTMNSIPRRVVEFWDAGHAVSWRRRTQLEKAIRCDWADDEPLGDTGRGA